MKNRAIEIHDSEIDTIKVEGGIALIHFPVVYIHESEGEPGVSAGTGWVQEADLRIGGAHVEGAFSEELRRELGDDAHWLHDGYIRLGAHRSDNMIPIPLDVESEVELGLESFGQRVTIRGTSAQLHLLGEAKYVEEFHPRS